jgi:hypothetical protein
MKFRILPPCWNNRGWARGQNQIARRHRYLRPAVGCRPCGLGRFFLGVAFVASVLASVEGAAGAEPPSPRPLSPGDIVVIDSLGGTDSRGALFRVDPSTGARTILSDFGDPSQGPINPLDRGSRPHHVRLAISNLTDILVVDGLFGTNARGALFRVDPSTGVRTILSDFGDPSQGPLGVLPGELATDHSGNILVIDSVGLQLFRVDPSTGARTIISDFSEPGQGAVGRPSGTGLAIENSGEILVADPFTAGSNGRGALFRVNPFNGARTIISDFGDPSQGPQGRADDITIDHSGNALVTDAGVAPPNFTGALFRVDPSTGARTIISNFGDPSQGPLGRPAGLAVDDLGDILVSGAALFRVNPSTGVRTILSGFPGTDVAIVPTLIVNDMVSLSPLVTSFDPTPVSNAPAGTFIITATFTSMTSIPIISPFFRVVEFSGGHLLLNAVGGPGGVGARLIPDVGTDGVLSPSESVTVDFLIGLQAREHFTFLTNLLGAPSP